MPRLSPLPMLWRRDALAQSALAERDGTVVIVPLYDVLREKVHHYRMIAARSASQQFEGKMILILTGDPTVDLVKKVIRTAEKAEFTRLRYVVQSANPPRDICVDLGTVQVSKDRIDKAKPDRSFRELL